MTEIILRRARYEDLPQLQIVEQGATPGLSYLADVYEMFMADDGDDLTVAELDGKLVACGKYSRQPDGSAWLETLRVLPEYQGRGIGKRFYEKFHRTADEQGVNTMRMYTGRTNVVSKGLAELYGFTLRGTFSIAKMSMTDRTCKAESWQRLTDGKAAFELFERHLGRWGELICYNRTFFRPTREVIVYLANKGLIYSQGENILAVGARFQPHLSNFILAYGGDARACLEQAIHQTLLQQASNLICIFPYYQTSLRNELLAAGFVMDNAELIVEEWRR